MKRGKKLMLLSLALLALCCIAAALLNMDFEEEYEEAPDTSVTILTLDPDTVTSLSWENLTEEKLSFTNDGSWTYDADPAFPLDTTLLEEILSELSTVAASRAIEEPEDPAQYGLNEPLSVITVTAGGSTFTLELGDETALGGERYAGTGDGNVYLVEDTLLDAFDHELYDLVLEEDLPDRTDLTAVTIDAEVNRMSLMYLPDSGLAYSDSYTWFLADVEGYTALDPELTEDLLQEFRYLAWADCVNYHAEDADLVQYGLDTPTAILTMEYTENSLPGTLTIEIGAYDDTGCCYARITGSRMVYLIDAAVSDAILYTTPAALLPDEVLLMDWDAVTSMDVILDGETYTITWDTETSTDDEGSVTEKAVYHLGDTQVWMSDTMDILDAMTSSGYATGLEPQRSEELRLVIHREDENFPDVEISFYRYDSTACLVQLLGESTVFTSRADVVSLIEELNSIVLG